MGKQEENKYSDETVKISAKIHNILFALRCIHDVFSVFNLELNVLVKKHINTNRATDVAGATRFYNRAEKEMEYALEITKKIYKDDEGIRQCSEDAYEALRHIYPTALNMTFTGEDNYDNAIMVVPMDLYPKITKYISRYHKTREKDVIAIVPPEELKKV